MQLDLFNDSHNVALRNDVIQSLETCDAAAARSAWESLSHSYPGDDPLDALLVLLETVEGRTQTVMQKHDLLQEARQALLNRIAPAAQRSFGGQSAALWLRSRWQELAQRAEALPYHAAHSDNHAAPLWLHAENWQAAVDAVTSIESWRRIPTPLFWMVQARLHLYGLQATWGILAELAWLSPHRLDELAKQDFDPTLRELIDQFDQNFSGVGDHSDLAWFPAWVLTERPGLASFLTLAQPSQHSDPEKAMRVVLELLGLERQGRHRDVVEQRKVLRYLHSSLYAAYMATR